MRRLLESHPCAGLTNYMWRKYRESGNQTVGDTMSFRHTPASGGNIEDDPRTFHLRDSVCRNVSHPGGTCIQSINVEPSGEPYVSLHQNHYLISKGTSLGAINFSSIDNVGVTMRAYVDGQRWTSTSRPSSFSMYVTRDNESMPNNRAFHINSSGSVYLGESEEEDKLISLGIYRPGVMKLPTVATVHDLGRFPSSDGLITYVKDRKMTVVSEGGSWKTLLTAPLSSTDIFGNTDSK